MTLCAISDLCFPIYRYTLVESTRFQITRGDIQTKLASKINDNSKRRYNAVGPQCVLYCNSSDMRLFKISVNVWQKCRKTRNEEFLLAFAQTHGKKKQTRCCLSFNSPMCDVKLSVFETKRWILIPLMVAFIILCLVTKLWWQIFLRSKSVLPYLDINYRQYWIHTGFSYACRNIVFSFKY